MSADPLFAGGVWARDYLHTGKGKKRHIPLERVLELLIRRQITHISTTTTTDTTTITKDAVIVVESRITVCCIDVSLVELTSVVGSDGSTAVVSEKVILKDKVGGHYTVYIHLPIVAPSSALPDVLPTCTKSESFTN